MQKAMNISHWYRQVRDFHLGMEKLDPKKEIRVHSSPEMGDRVLQGSLILEEALETLFKGLGLTIQINESTFDPDDKLNVKVIANYPPDLVEFYNGGMDLIVVILGALVSFGLPDEAGMELVNTNNLAKLTDGAHFNDIGKLVKSVGHKPPDFAKLIEDFKRKDIRIGDIVRTTHGKIPIGSTSHPGEVIEIISENLKLLLWDDSELIAPLTSCRLWRKSILEGSCYLSNDNVSTVGH